MIFEIANILLTVLLCSICIYTDYKNGLIYNIILLIFGIPILITNGLSLYFNPPYSYVEYVFHVILAIFISVVLYCAKIWAGGDLKLYIIIILGMPASIVLKQVINIHYIYIIPMLAFSLGYIYLIIESIIHMILVKSSIKKLFSNSVKNIFNYFKMYVCILFFNHIITFIFEGILNLHLYLWLQVFINFVFVTLINKYELVKNKMIFITVLISDIILGIFNISMFIDSKVYITFFLIFFLITTRTLIREYNYKEIKYDDLKKGMILSMQSSICLVNEKQLNYSKISDESLGARLSQEEVDDICDFCSKNTVYSKLYIVRKIPFALFLSVAALIVIIGGNYFEFENF